MKQLDTLLRPPFALASAIRHARVFHAHGVTAQGHAELGSHWWPVQGRIPVTARLSKGLGLPGPLPDFLGLAVRLHLAGGPWDLLLVTAQSRIILWPALSWSRARYSSVTAFRTRDTEALTWMLAEPEAGQPGTGSLAALADGDAPHFTLSLARARGPAKPAGRLSLDLPTDVPDDLQPSFDPVLNRPDGVDMWPEWVADARRAAYGAGRAGRDTEAPTPPWDTRA
ncbi:phosphodiesterase [Rhodococcus sp. NPDC003318]|uniref:phosphodiesterase n=1 Tax=Rhodococcus sp. NPDC003318 TaxID=3364503 RepID=UPI0036747363